ncbi:cold-shock protein [Escherichia coli]|nr:cold-shock protein [Escherichia coli]MBB8071522.1 cold-shock protein [Escherichia coli]
MVWEEADREISPYPDSALFFFNAVCIVSDNLLIIESFGEMAYNISYLTRVPGTNTLLACCCLLRPEEVNSEY